MLTGCLWMSNQLIKSPHSDYGDVMMGTMASEITSIAIVYSTISSGADQRKYQSSAPLGLKCKMILSQLTWEANQPLVGAELTKLIKSRSIRHRSDIVGSMSSRCQSDGLCYLGTIPLCHQLETFSALLALCAENSLVTGEFPSQRPVTWSFDVFCEPRLNKRLNKQSWGWWFETPSHSFWRHFNA